MLLFLFCLEFLFVVCFGPKFKLLIYFWIMYKICGWENWTSLPGTGTLGWKAWGEAGTLHPLGEALHPRHPSQFLLDTQGCGPTCSTCPLLPPVSTWLLISILTCRTSLLLDFRQSGWWSFCSWSFDVVVGGSEYCIRLCCQY